MQYDYITRYYLFTTLCSKFSFLLCTNFPFTSLYVLLNHVHPIPVKRSTAPITTTFLESSKIPVSGIEGGSPGHVQLSVHTLLSPYALVHVLPGGSHCSPKAVSKLPSPQDGFTTLHLASIVAPASNVLPPSTVAITLFLYISNLSFATVYEYLSTFVPPAGIGRKPDHVIFPFVCSPASVMPETVLPTTLASNVSTTF